MPTHAKYKDKHVEPIRVRWIIAPTEHSRVWIAEVTAAIVTNFAGGNVSGTSRDAIVAIVGPDGVSLMGRIYSDNELDAFIRGELTKAALAEAPPC